MPQALDRTSRIRRPSAHSLRSRLGRAVWNLVWLVLFRPSPGPLHWWRRAVLRIFGAQMGKGAVIHPSARVWAPWNLIMDDYSCLGPRTDCYNAAPVRLGEYSVVSQYAFLCTATHDISSLRLPLVTGPVELGKHAWVCADSFIGPGVTVGEGAVVGARSSAYKDVAPWTVVTGNPARFLKVRVVNR